MTTTTDDRDTYSVRVFRDHPEWNEVSRWFHMRHDLLKSLHVASYEILSHSRPSETHPLVREIALLHPGCVYVY